MRRALVAVCLAVLAISAAGGCGPSREVRKEVTPMPDTDSVPPTAAETLPLEEVPPDRLPAEVKEWVAVLTRGVTGPLQAGKTFGEQTFLLIYAGEQRSGGFRVQFLKAERRSGELTVTGRVVPPAGPAAAVISYPYGVARIPRHDGPIRFLLSGTGTGADPARP